MSKFSIVVLFVLLLCTSVFAQWAPGDASHPVLYADTIAVRTAPEVRVLDNLFISGEITSNVATDFGLGTLNPASKLHISSANSDTEGVRVENSAGEVVNFYFEDNSADSDFILSYTGTGVDDIKIQNNGSVTVGGSAVCTVANGLCSGGGGVWTQSGSDVYYNTGNVGIGTASPSSNLTIQGNGGSTRLYSGKSGGHTWIGMYDGLPGVGPRLAYIGYEGDGLGNFTINNQMAQGGIYFRTQDVIRMLIKDTGNVGIGTNTPTSPLEIAATTANNYMLKLIHASPAGWGNIIVGQSSGGTVAAPTDLTGAEGLIGLQGQAYRNGAYRFSGAITILTDGTPVGNNVPSQLSVWLNDGTSNFERFVIKSSGNVGIGTATPSAKLEIESDASAPTFEHTYVGNANWGALIKGQVARGTIGSLSPVTDGTPLSLMAGYGYQNNDYRYAGSINIVTDGTPSGNNVPGKIDFWTSDGLGGVGARLTIKPDGKIGIGNTNTGSNAGTDLCIDANNEICRCGQCA